MAMVVPLRRKRDLLEETAKLLNSEWPRSLTARLASLEEGESDLPCSFILFRVEGSGEDQVLGHVRLHGVTGRSNAVLVEGLLVRKEWRGKGFGRILMTAAEDYTKTLHYTSLHLSTHDQQDFYRHLGYTDGPPSTPLRSCVIKFNQQESECLVGKVEYQTDSVTPMKSLSASPLLPESSHLNPLPPPPPPPPLPPVMHSCVNNPLTWLKKNL